MNAFFRRMFAPVALLAATAFAADSATSEPATPTLRLPDVKVTGMPNLPPPESWRYARIEGFEVLSNASDKTTRSLLGDFQKFRQGLRLIWPAPPKPLASATIIICAKQNKFDAFLPASVTAANELNKVSLLLRNREQVAIVVDLEADRIAVDDPKTLADTNAGSVEFSIDSSSQLYRQYVHYLLSQVDVRPPAWLEEGLAQIVMDIEVNDTSLIYGKVNTNKNATSGGQAAGADGNDPTANTDAIVGEQPFNVVLQHQSLIPMAQFLAITHDSPEAQNPLGNNLWAKQAYAFVHFCLFGENLRYKDALATFLSRLAREPASEALFKKCFKVGYAEMNQQLRGYILYTKHQYQKYALKPGDKLSGQGLEIRDATPAEVAVIKGDALRLAGHLDTAHTSYLDGYLRGDRGAPLLSGLGLTENAAGHPDRARELLEAGIKAGVNRPSAYVELARLRLAQFTPTPDARLDHAQVVAVLTPLFDARKNPPALPETYEVIAATWAKSVAAPTGDNLAVLDEGIKAFPRDTVLAAAAIQLYSSIGLTEKANAIGRFSLKYADADGKSQLLGVLASLPAPAAK